MKFKLGLKYYIIPSHKLGQSFCGHKYLKSRLVVAISVKSSSHFQIVGKVIVKFELFLKSIF